MSSSQSDYCSSSATSARPSYNERLAVMFGSSPTSSSPLISNDTYSAVRVRFESVQTSQSLSGTPHQSQMSVPFTTLQVFSDLLARHGASGISIQMNHKSTSSTSDLSFLDFDRYYSEFFSASSSSKATCAAYDLAKGGNGTELNGRTRIVEAKRTPVPGGGPSGVSVRVDFRIEDHPLRGMDTHDGMHQWRNLFEQAMQEILQELHSRRILLAPVAATSFRQTSRLHPRPFLIHEGLSSERAGTVSVSYMLPTDGSLWSSEGLQAFLHLKPRCGQSGCKAGIWAVASPLEWSHWLLGSPDRRPSSAKLGAQRRMWVEASTSTASPSSGIRSSNRLTTSSQHRSTYQTSLSTGIEYAIMIPSLASMSSADVSMLSVVPIVDPTSLKTCALADSTQLLVITPSNESDDRDEPSWKMRVASLSSPWSLTESIENLVSKDSVLDSSVAEPLSLEQSLGHRDRKATLPPPWSIHYSIELRDGQANSGTLRSTVVSADQACPTLVEVHQVIPGVFKPVWQSLSIHIVSKNGSLTSASPSTAASMDRPKQRIYWKDLRWSDLRIDDNADETIRLSFRHVLPPSSSLELSLEYKPEFLNFERFPADPNHGFELPPFVAHLSAACTPKSNCSGDTCPAVSATLYSDSPLLLAPIPDMSMPFNVISLTCTLYAFIIGSFIHLIVRKGSERVKYRLYPELKPKPPVQRIKGVISDSLRALMARLKAARRVDDGEEPRPELVERD